MPTNYYSNVIIEHKLVVIAREILVGLCLLSGGSLLCECHDTTTTRHKGWMKPPLLSPVHLTASVVFCSALGLWHVQTFIIVDVTWLFLRRTIIVVVRSKFVTRCALEKHRIGGKCIEDWGMVAVDE